MKRILVFTLIIYSHFACWADNRQLLLRLDSIIAQKGVFDRQKITRVQQLKKQLNVVTDAETKMALLGTIFQEYYSFCYDSAMTYVDRGQRLASEYHDGRYKDLFNLYQAKCLFRAGLFHEAQDAAEAIDSAALRIETKFEYYHTISALYARWGDYCRGTTYEKKYKDMALKYAQNGIGYLSESHPDHDFYLAGYYQMIGDTALAKKCYLTFLGKSPKNRHTYAMALFSLGDESGIRGDKERELSYYIQAAISDQLAINRESSALRKVATLLLEDGSFDVERAERYIMRAMADAQFYGTRLRAIETAFDYPTVSHAYTSLMKERNRVQIGGLLLTCLLFVIATVFWIFAKRQNQKQRKSQQQLACINTQLAELNEKLRQTGCQRERLAKVFIDLSASQMERHEKLKTLVIRKVKVNKAAELLMDISSYKFSEEETAAFLGRFDKAFLELYPTFIDEFNSLLEKGNEQKVSEPGTLNTILRIYALVRLGVTHTHEIASLLHLSNQTVYNARSKTRSLARVRENFDQVVQTLCIMNG